MKYKKKHKPLFTYIKGRLSPEHYTRIIPNKKKLEENKRNTKWEID